MPNLSERWVPILNELEQLFWCMNKGFFNNKLRLPTLVVQPEKKVILRFVSDSFHIVVGSKFGKITVKGLKESMLHEMVHIKNYLSEKIDCTSNQYHNGKFLEEALKVGFFVQSHRTQGWGVTKFLVPKKKVGEVGSFFRAPTLAVRNRDKILKHCKVDEKILQSAKKEIRKCLTPVKKCFLKYACSCNSFRTGKRPDGKHPPKVVCLDCGQPYICVEKGYEGKGRVIKISKILRKELIQAGATA